MISRGNTIDIGEVEDIVNTTIQSIDIVTRETVQQYVEEAAVQTVDPTIYIKTAEADAKYATNYNLTNNHYTKATVDGKIAAITGALDDYVKSTDLAANHYDKATVDGKIAAITGALDDYVKDVDLTDSLKDYYTKAQTDSVISSAIANIKIEGGEFDPTILNDYVKNVDLAANHYDKATVDGKIDALYDTIETMEVEVDLSGYVTTGALTSQLTDYYTTAQTDSAISSAIANIKIEGGEFDPTILNDYVKSTVLSDTLEDYVKSTVLSDTLEDYVKSTVLSDTLEDYVKSTVLSDTLEGYVKSTVLSDTLEGYVKSTVLSDTLEGYATTDYVDGKIAEIPTGGGGSGWTCDTAKALENNGVSLSINEDGYYVLQGGYALNPTNTFGRIDLVNSLANDKSIAHISFYEVPNEYGLNLGVNDGDYVYMSYDKNEDKRTLYFNGDTAVFTGADTKCYGNLNVDGTINAKNLTLKTGVLALEKDAATWTRAYWQDGNFQWWIEDQNKRMPLFMLDPNQELLNTVNLWIEEDGDKESFIGRLWVNNLRITNGVTLTGQGVSGDLPITGDVNINGDLTVDGTINGYVKSTVLSDTLEGYVKSTVLSDTLEGYATIDYVNGKIAEIPSGGGGSEFDPTILNDYVKSTVLSDTLEDYATIDYVDGKIAEIPTGGLPLSRTDVTSDYYIDCGDFFDYTYWTYTNKSPPYGLLIDYTIPLKDTTWRSITVTGLCVQSDGSWSVKSATATTTDGSSVTVPIELARIQYNPVIEVYELQTGFVRSSMPTGYGTSNWQTDHDNYSPPLYYYEVYVFDQRVDINKDLTLTGKLNGFKIGTVNNGGNYMANTFIPTVTGDGVMEVGKHIDFHSYSSATETNDYSVRLSAASNHLSCSGSFTINGGNKLALTGYNSGDGYGPVADIGHLRIANSRQGDDTTYLRMVSNNELNLMTFKADNVSVQQPIYFEFVKWETDTAGLKNGGKLGLWSSDNTHHYQIYCSSDGSRLYLYDCVGEKHHTLWEPSKTITHQTNVTGQVGTFCETNGGIYDGYESIDQTDCICQVVQSTTLNPKIVGIITDSENFASHGDCLVKVVPGTYKLGDILCPDISGLARVATETELSYMMLHAIPRPKITSLNTGIDGTVACFIV